MKKFMAALGVLMISFLVSACSNKEDSSALFTVGGVVSGSTGELVLQNNGGDALTVAANGPFTFSTALVSGSSYSVTVRTNPDGQTCVVSNGAGTILVSNVTNVSVDCFQRGGLDVAFNSPNGFLVQNNAAGGNGDDLGNAVAVDSLGRILVTGSSATMGGTTDMVVWRFNADGTLDTTFNGAGIVVYDNTAGGSGDDSGKAVTVDSLDRILVTGSTTSAGNRDMVAWRFNDDGTLDTTFNSAGFVMYDNTAGGSGADSGNAIAIDSQARILVTGSTTSAGNRDMAVWRFNADGTVDYGFNKGSGIFVHSGAAGGTGDDAGNAIAIDSSRRIVVVGSSTNSTGNTDMVVWRLKDDGSLDTTFSSDGTVVLSGAAWWSTDGSDSGYAVAIDSQGRILVAGTSTNSVAGNNDMVLSRLTATGALDTTFNGSGIVTKNGAAGFNGDDSGNAIAVDSQGILVTGSSTNSSGNKDMVLWRFKTDGSLDTAYGSSSSGIIIENGSAGGTGDDTGNAVAVDSQGRILVTGSSTNSDDNKDMVIWRVFP